MAKNAVTIYVDEVIADTLEGLAEVIRAPSMSRLIEELVKQGIYELEKELDVVQVPCSHLQMNHKAVSRIITKSPCAVFVDS